MTDVNMDEPLPEFELEDRKTRAAFLMTGIVGESIRVTPSHLVQVLAALTGEQLGAVVRALTDERKQALAAAIDWPDEREEYERSRKRLYAQAMEEKARADRAIKLARVGWESARLLAICPPTFGAPATERAADEALVQIKELETKNG
jgi:hypothetical protein